VKAAQTDLKAWDEWRDGVAVQILALELIANLTGAAMVRAADEGATEEQQQVSRAVQKVLVDAQLLPLTLQLLDKTTYSMPEVK
jgi:hypothetical protein